MALPIFAITLFVSAFLLFLVQPMIGKMILPNLGGTPQVWNTCMVFFQIALLAGYAYTHTVSTRLKLRTQLVVHGVLLLVPLALLLTGTFSGRVYQWVPPPGANPVLSTLGILALIVGLPFFVVSTSAPLLQKWFGHTGHTAAKDPYFLYGASNLGSMLSLILYPVLVEPLLGLLDQSWTWAIGYIALVVLFFVCVSMVWNSPPSVELAGEEEKEKPEAPKEEHKEPVTAVTAKPQKGAGLSTRIRKGAKQRGRAPAAPVSRGREVTSPPPTIAYSEERSDDITVWRRMRWVLLAFAPSSLMLGITTYISTDVSAIPLFWVIPLALYLLSFILVFSKWPVVWTRIPHTLTVMTMPIIMFFFIILLLTHEISPIWRTIMFCILGFFMTTMVCHGELARDRPSTRFLTEFYLWMSVGGMLGGVFNALFAPVVFTGLVELPIAVTVGCLMRPQTRRLYPVDLPILIIFCALIGIIFGFLYGSWLFLFVGLVIGVIVAISADFTRSAGGWTESMLIGMFPDLGTWADQKGKELKKEISDHETGGEEKVKPRLRPATAPDYYVLNYIMDFGLPLLVALFLLLVYNFEGYSSLNRQDASGVKGGIESFLRGMGMKAEEAQVAAELNGFRALVFGIPLVCAMVLFTARPLRCGLTVGALLLITGMVESRRENTEVLHRDRSYFGILRVMERDDPPISVAEASQMNIKPGTPTPYTYLMHGTTHHGLNYQSPSELRRLATTYYHRFGPVGVIMERFNWFPGPQNTYWADNRYPASVVAMGANPLADLVNLWSEPPYATVGLGTGTMASYGRPMQHVTFYEIDNKIRGFSLPKITMYKLSSEDIQAIKDGNGSADVVQKLKDKMLDKDYPTIQAFQDALKETLSPEEFSNYYPKLESLATVREREPYFNYLNDARQKRGVNVEVIMGDARLSMRTDREKTRENERQESLESGKGMGTKQLDAYDFHQGMSQHRQGYYHAIELDAFSSDAIPVHLISKEAMIQYFDKLAPGGVLMVHTSNRHVELPDPVMDIVADINKGDVKDQVTGRRLELEYRVVNCYGKDSSSYVLGDDNRFKKAVIGSGDRGHFQSEYVMVARKVPGESKEQVEQRWNKRLKQVLPKIEQDLLKDHVQRGLDLGASYIPQPSSSEDRANYTQHENFLRGENNVKTPPSSPLNRQTWQIQDPPGRRVWTDDYSNLMSVFRWGLH